MQGRVLAFEFRTGEGVITGADGNRYRFAVAEWKPDFVPKAGQPVDFEAREGDAFAIYSVGASVPARAGGRPVERKDKVAAALLAFFLGGIGVHKFYLGRTGAGVTMLLCSLFGFILLFLPTLIVCTIAFVEFIIYLTLSDEDFERRYMPGGQSWF